MKCHFPLQAVLFCCCTLLGGCSGLKPYPGNPARNLDIHTRADSGSILSSTRVSLDIYSVGPECRTDYAGTLELNASAVSVGLPPDTPSYLVFRFNSASFLASSSSVTRYDTVFTPRYGQRYDVDVSYVDDIYNVIISEKPSATAAARVIEPEDLGACNN